MKRITFLHGLTPLCSLLFVLTLSMGGKTNQITAFAVSPLLATGALALLIKPPRAVSSPIITSVLLLQVLHLFFAWKLLFDHLGLAQREILLVPF